MARISCLGPSGSYSELAAVQFGAGEPLPAESFREAIELLLAGEADACVLPIENSIQGGVLQNLDLLERTESVFAVQELVLPIDHRLATKEGVRVEDITRIYSHEQAIGQCANFLRENFPHAQLEYTDSTVKSLSLLDEHSAGIVGAHIRRAGIVISPKNIADETRNFTHFLLVKRGKESLPAHTEKVFLCLSIAHEPGSLFHLLGIVERFGLNLTKIESRPMRDRVGQYCFFMELEGDIANKTVRDALAAIEKACLKYRLLGAYQSINNPNK